MNFAKRLLLFFVIVLATISASLLPVPSQYHSTAAPGSDGLAASPVMLFENHARRVYNNCGLENKDLPFSIFKYALSGYYNLVGEGKIMAHKKVLSIIDFRKSANEERYFVVDLASERLLYHTLVAHGKNSGMVYARYFSNTMSSLQSSLGFFRTAETYYGDHGYSMRLDGMERDINSLARPRAIVMHGADYVSKSFVARHGYLGRSWGCPALPLELTRPIINTVKNGSCLFAYSDDLFYLNNSNYINFYRAAETFVNLGL